DTQLEERMGLVRTIVGLGNALRGKQNIRNRQPLNSITVVIGAREQAILKPYENLIMEELNVKNIIWLENGGDLVKLIIKPNYRLLGKKFGPQMKEAADAISKLDPSGIDCLERGECVAVLGQTVSGDEVLIERLSTTGAVLETKKGITVGLDTAISDELYLEGLAQEVKNRVNNMRKEALFDKEDRISILWTDGGKKLSEAIVRFSKLIMAETLAVSIEKGSAGSSSETVKEWEIEGEKVTLALSRIKR
ncbi:MAG: hypothetical protein JNL74_08335, partial [Fibrobacteres bacterium]|nr:hypothetical protein [Fibrobacterota bacterium]